MINSFLFRRIFVRHGPISILNAVRLGEVFLWEFAAMEFSPPDGGEILFSHK